MRREGTGGRGGRRGRREGELAAKAEDASGKSCLGPKASCSSRGTRTGRCILGLRKTLKRRAQWKADAASCADSQPGGAGRRPRSHLTDLPRRGVDETASWMCGPDGSLGPDVETRDSPDEQPGPLAAAFPRVPQTRT